MDRADCLSLVLLKSLSMSIPFRAVFIRSEPRSGSCVRSLLSLLDQMVGRYMLRSSSHLLAGLPCFWYPFLIGWYCWVPGGDKLGPAVFVMFGYHPCLLCLRIPTT